MARSSSSKRGSLYADLEHLRTLFSSLDPDNTGYIGHEELSRLAQSESGMDESMVPQLLESLDRDKDGRVSNEHMCMLLPRLHGKMGRSGSQPEMTSKFCR